ncbi:MAG TPA: DUF2281 domain-containing protein [Mucilaginibacter sp.]|jgi:hypothetical protein
METVTLEKKIAKLPKNLKLKVEEYVDALLNGESDKNTSGDPLKIEKGFGGGKGLIAYMENDFNEPLEEKKLKREFGSLKGFVTYMADDFDAPLEEFKDYM